MIIGDQMAEISSSPCTCRTSMIRGCASTSWRRRDDAHWTFGTLPCCFFQIHVIENVRVYDQDEWHANVMKSSRLYRF